MRLPIVQFPDIVANNLRYFASVFQTEEQKRHFCEYVTGLMVGDKKTVAAMNNLFLNKNDQSALNKFLTQAAWNEGELNRLRVQFELERLHRRPVSAKAGRLLIDDTLAHHTQCSIEELSRLKDHNLNRYVWAHNVVTSYYLNRADQFPVDFQLYLQFRQKKWLSMLVELAQQVRAHPTLEGYQRYLVSLLAYDLRRHQYRPKTQMATELLRQAVTLDLPFDVVLFDGWYCNQTVIKVVRELGKDWVSGCPKNRKVLFKNRWVQLQEFSPTLPAEAYRPVKINDRVWWVFSKVMPMDSLQRQRIRIVAAYENELKLSETPTFYATNRRDWEAKRILMTYFDRWPTETFNEDVKGCLGFEDYQLRRLWGIKRHWYLSFVAYSLLSDQGPPGRSRWAVRGRFYSTGERCRAVADELLGHLVHWIVQQSEAGVKPDQVLNMLLA